MKTFSLTVAALQYRLVNCCLLNTEFFDGVKLPHQLLCLSLHAKIPFLTKKNANLNSIKNWRPLTLLNCDYKIATKAIASRIKMVLPKLVSNDQNGFIRYRFIGENIRLIDSVIKYTKVKNMPGLLLFLDF